MVIIRQTLVGWSGGMAKLSQSLIHSLRKKYLRQSPYLQLRDALCSVHDSGHTRPHLQVSGYVCEVRRAAAFLACFHPSGVPCHQTELIDDVIEQSLELHPATRPAFSGSKR